MNNIRQSGIRFQILVSCSIVLGMLVLAAALISHSYNSTRAILIDLAKENVHQIAMKLDSQVERHTEPVITSIKFLSQDSLVASQSHESRMKKIGLLKMILDENTVLDSVFICYKNGDFFLLRKIKNDQTRHLVGAPKKSEYMVQSVERNRPGRGNSAQWIFFDKFFQRLSQIKPKEFQADVRARDWFVGAMASDAPFIGSPHLFYTTKEVGVTLSMRASSPGTVVGVDSSIAEISGMMKSFVPDDQSRFALVNQNLQVIGFPELNKFVHETADGHFRLSRVNELGIPLFRQLVENKKTSSILQQYMTEDGVWFGQSIKIGPSGKERWSLLYGIPENALLERARRIFREQLLWSGLVIIVLLAIGWRLGKFITRPMLSLSKMIEGMKAFEFKSDQTVKYPIREVNILSQSLSDMSAAIKNFQSISMLLSQESDLDKMLNGVVSHLVKITSSEMAVIYLYDSEKEQLVQATKSPRWGKPVIPCPKAQKSDIVDICQKEFAGDESFVCVPLSDRQMSITGALILKANTSDTGDSNVNQAFLEFVTRISGSAATAIETRKLVEEQKQLIDGIIRLLADAIDAKSPYTGGHCERVPMLAEMLIDHAQEEMNGVFAGFMMDENQRREFKIAAWLHDCGKITSREYIIDKATKLETIYNRIHEIRTRFEVLWRDKEIDFWKGIANGELPDKLERTLRQEQQTLLDDFALIAKLNIGGETVQDSDIARLKDISRTSWQRHFSRRIGLSRHEADKLAIGEEILPATEKLIDDLPEHIVPWGNKKPPVEKDNPENIWGFDMSLPDYEMNLGEIYNLSIERGTLTKEERFLINDHIVQTIRMLTQLPFPEGMKNVPDIAGNHHERVDGRGYPRRLTGEQLTIPEKIMALADVFEALTAKDRPYKNAKTLSESLKILAGMVNEQHIDKNVFRLFIERKVFQDYAEGYLLDKQKDEVDVDELYRLAGIDV
ncbi:HD domain-containing phosphohydrolase [Vibrio salinus]|uniref:HD domain-containing phosphohydrolase n=1 Tax=Vibrio salinus TaxID=2899784 RepID=UPI001E556993|nr:HD domain-containing phosphohydrolase [Vibrio salinus]MCE0494329.1 HD domain-containing protein [Vibrio salinus]